MQTDASRARAYINVRTPFALLSRFACCSILPEKSPQRRRLRLPFLQKVGVPVYPEQVGEQLMAKHRAMTMQSTSTADQLVVANGASAPRKSRTGTGRRVTLRPVVFGIYSRRTPNESATNPAVHHQVPAHAPFSTRYESVRSLYPALVAHFFQRGWGFAAFGDVWAQDGHQMQRERQKGRR